MQASGIGGSPIVRGGAKMGGVTLSLAAYAPSAFGGASSWVNENTA